MSANGFELIDYVPPEWANCLKVKPNKKLKLCQLPTPIHRFKVPGLPENVEMFVKRDDMTGGVFGGNKHRKLEFLLADAVEKEFNAVLTLGTYCSSHSMTTSTVAKMVGLDCYTIIYTFAEKEKEISNEVCKAPGMFLPIVLCSTKCYRPNIVFNVDVNSETILNAEVVQQIEKETGKTIYPIPIGGSYTPMSLYAYIDAWEEMTSQGCQERFDDVIVACGSGGTAIGLGIGNYLTGSKLRVHSISIGQTYEKIYVEAKKELENIGLDVEPRKMLNILHIHDHVGYEKNNEEDYDFIANVADKTGVLCDRVYVGKALKELVYLLNYEPQQFKGNRILFIHTGGVVGQFDGHLAGTLNKLSGLKIEDLH